MHNDFENTQEDKPYLNTFTLTFSLDFYFP